MAVAAPFTAHYNTPNKSVRQPVARRGVILHHAAMTSLSGLLALSMGAKQVSASALVKDNQAYDLGMGNTYRPWSVADGYWDSAMRSVETANESTVGWTISASSAETLAKLIAYWAQQDGFYPHRNGDPKTWTVIGHREVYTIHGASYATACPGSMDLDAITRRAQQILAADSGSQNGNDPMPLYAEYTDPRKNRKLKNGEWSFLHLNKEAHTSFVSGKTRGTAVVNFDFTGLKPGGAVHVRVQAARVGSPAKPNDAQGKNGVLGYMDTIEIIGTGGHTYGQAVFTFDLNGATDALRVVIAPVDGDVTLVKAKTTLTYWKK